jgi:hypothetical protein
MGQDALRQVLPHTVINRVVYDCLEPPPSSEAGPQDPAPSPPPGPPGTAQQPQTDQHGQQQQQQVAQGQAGYSPVSELQPRQSLLQTAASAPDTDRASAPDSLQMLESARLYHSGVALSTLSDDVGTGANTVATVGSSRHGGTKAGAEHGSQQQGEPATQPSQISSLSSTQQQQQQQQPRRPGSASSGQSTVSSRSSVKRTGSNADTALGGDGGQASGSSRPPSQGTGGALPAGRRYSGSGRQHQGQYDYYPDLKAWYKPSGPEDTTLVFESRFESGNLRRAVQVREGRVLKPEEGGWS